MKKNERNDEEQHQLSASLEDYLEAIHHIIDKKRVARAKDIAAWMNVGASSVTGALHALAEKGLINYTPYDVITTTEEGDRAAEDVIRRHESLQDFFVNILGVEPEEADQAACKMEHAITRPILEKIIRFVEFVESCPRAGEDWLERFHQDCYRNAGLDNCASCMDSSLKRERDRVEARENRDRPMTLPMLQTGQRARITRVSMHGRANRRLMEMGMTTGSVIEIERVAPLGDPVDIKIRGYHLSLRRSEADGIEVELLQDRMEA